MDPIKSKWSYGDYLLEYRDGVNRGEYDKQLTAGQRKLVARILLLAAARGPIVTPATPAPMEMNYPPTEQQRQDVVAEVHYWLGRTYAEPGDFGLSWFEWDDAIGVAIQIIRNV